METLATIELGDAGLWALDDKVNKLNKRAKRYGMNELEVTVMREFTIVWTSCDVNRYDIEIKGCAPCINGWCLAARIENNQIGTVVRVIPGKFEDDDYSNYRKFDFKHDVCEYCNTCRYRKNVYVLKKGDEVKVIGRNCLADYLRCENADDFARYAEFVDQCISFTDFGLSEYADNEGFGSRGCRPNVELVSFLTTVQTCIRRLGWVSRTAAHDQTATADSAYYIIFGHDNKEFIKRNELYATNGDRELATKAVEWVKSLPPADTEYMDIIRRIGIAGETDDGLSGYAASIILAYQRDCEWKIEREVKNKEFIGNIKERLRDVVVTVVRVRYIEGDYGTRTIVTMEVDLGDSVAPLCWFASGSLEFNEGERYKLTGTVKNHKDDKFGKQTIINRCKLEAIVAA